MCEPASTQLLPRTEAQVVLVAKSLGLEVPATCMPGVMANLALLHNHANTLIGCEEPARK